MTIKQKFALLIILAVFIGSITTAWHVYFHSRKFALQFEPNGTPGLLKLKIIGYDLPLGSMHVSIRSPSGWTYYNADSTGIVTARDIDHEILEIRLNDSIVFEGKEAIASKFLQPNPTLENGISVTINGALVDAASSGKLPPAK